MTAMSQCLQQSNACASAKVTSYESSKHEDLAVYYRYKYNDVGAMYAWGAVQWVTAGEGSCPSATTSSRPEFLSASRTRSDVAALAMILGAAMVCTFSRILVAD